MKTQTNTAIITGGSSGIGLAAAKAFLDKGYTVYNLSRRDFSCKGINHVHCDVTDEAEVISSINNIAKLVNSIDVLITCAGFGIAGAVEFTDLEEAKRQIDVNFFGTVNVIKAVLPYMRNQCEGKIICVSSVAAEIPIPFQTYYSVSKSAINSYVLALTNEVKSFNIQVCAVMPGDIATGFTNARKTNLTGDDIYEGRITRSIQSMEKDELNGMSADYAGRFISKIIEKKNLKPIYTIGFKYKLFVFLSKVLPQRIVSAIVAFLYAK
ncbi:MAG TPA: SDR family NAD(P)-dependent oxidoreductase [Clostridia bacterium]|nr:SDR family NAD(P)-dependent oxidoreductase [Clostridia bacterium]